LRNVLMGVFLSGAAALFAGCVAESDAGPTAALTAAVPAPPSLSGTTTSEPAPTMATSAIDVQPRVATYRCDGDKTLRVENLRSSVVLTDPQGDSVTLPASPASQQTRYGQTGYALVLEGNDALYMKGGKPPINCRR